MSIISPDELEKKLTPEEERKYKELEKQINEDLKKAEAYSGGYYNVNFKEIPSRRVIRKVNEEAKKAGWSKVTLKESDEGDYLEFCPKENKK